MYKKALVFLNGIPPKDIHEIDTSNALVLVVDGAFNYINIEKIPFDYLIGDLDSVKNTFEIPEEKLISIIDQNSTDFEKALQFLVERRVLDVEVYGVSGKEQDHYLGNLYAALRFKNKLNITMFDHFSEFYFASKIENIATEEGKKISLFPFPEAKEITTGGLKYPLNSEDLHIHSRIGIRNEAINQHVLIQFTEGELLLFVEK